MIPGEVFPGAVPIQVNVGRVATQLTVLNIGDRPIQVGSHFHFFEVNRALQFERQFAYGRRLDIAAGTAVRFEPGESRTVNLIPVGGTREVIGLNGLVNGPLDAEEDRSVARVAAFLGGQKVLGDGGPDAI